MIYYLKGFTETEYLHQKFDICKDNVEKCQFNKLKDLI